ncbi:hypothetical protein DBW_1864 [Desulfuromonas sp. DDH964]|uniref:hypothetical protein n=1 Tax=Desulfuromonas sp. DDH964 TaxID=1823759 RepID=UPI00078D104B|nr:hypothetical protein [Desulfuromonas sp. DDH964]AMV72218.1 hypothetical protein DBW_1864 [Desulfuromonas sp. DDH964]
MGFEEKKFDKKTGENFCFVALKALPKLLDDSACREHIFQFLRPGISGRSCPSCGATLTTKMQATFQRGGKSCCLLCGRQFNWLTGTALQGSKLSPSEIMLLAAMVKLSVPPEDIASAIGRTLQTVKIWQPKVADLFMEGGQ